MPKYQPKLCVTRVTTVNHLIFVTVKFHDFSVLDFSLQKIIAAQPYSVNTLGLLYWYPIIFSRQNKFANLMPLTNLAKILCLREKKVIYSILRKCYALCCMLHVFTLVLFCFFFLRAPWWMSIMWLHSWRWRYRFIVWYLAQSDIHPTSQLPPGHRTCSFISHCSCLWSTQPSCHFWHTELFKHTTCDNPSLSYQVPTLSWVKRVHVWGLRFCMRDCTRSPLRTWLQFGDVK